MTNKRRHNSMSKPNHNRITKQSPNNSSSNSSSSSNNNNNTTSPLSPSSVANKNNNKKKKNRRHMINTHPPLINPPPIISLTGATTTAQLIPSSPSIKRIRHINNTNNLTSTLNDLPSWQSQMISGWPFVGREKEAIRILKRSVMNWYQRHSIGARLKFPLLAQKFGSGKTTFARNFHNIISSIHFSENDLILGTPEAKTNIHQLRSVPFDQVLVTFPSFQFLQFISDKLCPTTPTISPHLAIIRYVQSVNHPVIFFFDDLSEILMADLLVIMENAILSSTNETPFFMFILATRIAAIHDVGKDSISASFDWVLLEPLTEAELHSCVTHLLQHGSRDLPSLHNIIDNHLDDFVRLLHENTAGIAILVISTVIALHWIWERTEDKTMFPTLSDLFDSTLTLLSNHSYVGRDTYFHLGSSSEFIALAWLALTGTPTPLSNNIPIGNNNFVPLRQLVRQFPVALHSTNDQEIVVVVLCEFQRKYLLSKGSLDPLLGPMLRHPIGGPASAGTVFEMALCSTLVNSHQIGQVKTWGAMIPSLASVGCSITNCEVVLQKEVYMIPKFKPNSDNTPHNCYELTEAELQALPNFSSSDIDWFLQRVSYGGIYMPREMAHSADWFAVNQPLGEKKFVVEAQAKSGKQEIDLPTLRVELNKCSKATVDHPVVFILFAQNLHPLLNSITNPKGAVCLAEGHVYWEPKRQEPKCLVHVKAGSLVVYTTSGNPKEFKQSPGAKKDYFRFQGTKYKYDPKADSTHVKLITDLESNAQAVAETWAENPLKAPHHFMIPQFLEVVILHPTTVNHLVHHRETEKEVSSINLFALSSVPKQPSTAPQPSVSAQSPMNPLFTYPDQPIDQEWMKKIFPTKDDAKISSYVKKFLDQEVDTVGVLAKQSIDTMVKVYGIPGAIATDLWNGCHPTKH